MTKGGFFFFFLSQVKKSYFLRNVLSARHCFKTHLETELCYGRKNEISMRMSERKEMTGVRTWKLTINTVIIIKNMRNLWLLHFPFNIRYFRVPTFNFLYNMSDYWANKRKTWSSKQAGYELLPNIGTHESIICWYMHDNKQYSPEILQEAR